MTDGEDLPFSSHLCLTLTLGVLKMQTSREGCHYKDYHYILHRAGQMISAGKPLQCTIFVWGHQGGWIYYFLFCFVFFVVKQGNVHIALFKNYPTAQKRKKVFLFLIIQSIFFFVCGFPLLLLFISYFIPIYPYICLCRFVLLVSFCLTEGYLRSFTKRPFT